MDEKLARGTYTFWHQSFYQYLTARCPPTSDTRSELELSRFPSRADLVISRRRGEEPRDGEATIFPDLWPLLSNIAVLEFKSPTRGFRRTELLRFFRYGLEYHELYYDDVRDIDGLTRVLIVPELNKALRDELGVIHAGLEHLGNGYARIDASMLYTTYVLFTNEIVEAENDEFLKIFSHHQVTDPAAIQWCHQWMTRSQLMQQDVRNLEGYDEMFAKIVRSLTPEQIRMLTPEQLSLAIPEYLNRLTPEQIEAVLSDEQLDALFAKRRQH